MKISILTGLLILLTLGAKAQEYASLHFSNRVIRSFTQGDNALSNRSAISLIKCAIATFGLDDVLKKTEKTQDSLIITLRSGETVRISSAELALCKARSGFKLMHDEAIFDKAILLYAIMAKRIVDNSNPIYSNCHNLSNALRFLHNRKNTIDIIDLVPLLGFNYIEVEIYSEICYVHEKGDAVAFACYQIFDDEGFARKLDFKHWYKRGLENSGADVKRLNIILANFTSDNGSDDSAVSRQADSFHVPLTK